VVVTATRTPVPSEAAGADVDTLSSGQLEAMQPAAADDAMRFLPGAVVNTAGQRGGISSLFVRGGESTYNKVIVDGVYISEAGETFDFGTLPLAQADRLEFVRGAQSTLYGSDAMTSVVQVWTRTGSTRSLNSALAPMEETSERPTATRLWLAPTDVSTTTFLATSSTATDRA
jgi:vitamin B12 transporter